MDAPTPGSASDQDAQATPVAMTAARPQPLAVGLFNDAADEAQVVSLATSHALRHLLRRGGAHVRHASYRGDWHELGEGTLEEGVAAALASPELRRVFADVDVVVVAGETVRERPHRHLLAILGAAQHLDLPTYLVNASIGAVTEGVEILAGLAECTVRDRASASALRAAGVPHRVVTDVVHAAPFSPVARRDFTDHLVVTDCEPARRSAFIDDLAAVRASWPGMVADYTLAPGALSDWTHAVADLASAAAVITGGRDGATLALAAGVPFVVLGADSGGHDLVGSLDGYPDVADDLTQPLDVRVQAAIDARAWFAQVAKSRTRVAADALGRLRPSLTFGGRDDAWTGNVDGVVDVVREVTPAGGSVLHAGAGQGQLVETLARLGLRAWGADVARRLDRPDRTRYSKATPAALPFADRVFSTVVVSAEWLETLEVEEMHVAVGELMRVASGAIVVEVSGRPIRTERARHEHTNDEWWRRRFFAMGLHVDEVNDALVTHGVGPTGGTLLVLQAHAALCPSCRRPHAAPDLHDPVHPGILLAAANERAAGARR